MCVRWVTQDGRVKKADIKAGDVNQVLLSAQRLRDDGWETLLYLKEPVLRKASTDEEIQVRCEKGKVPYWYMWVKVKSDTGANEY